MSLLEWRCSYIDLDGLRCDGRQDHRLGDGMRYLYGPRCPMDRRHGTMRKDATEERRAISGAARRWRP